MSNHFVLLPYTSADKDIEIIYNGNWPFSIRIDYDDVDKDLVDRNLIKIVNALNGVDIK